MNSKLGKEQKKGHHVRRSPNFDLNSDKKQKKGQNDNGLILGRVSINTRTRPRPSAVMFYYSDEYSDSIRHIPRCDITSQNAVAILSRILSVLSFLCSSIGHPILSNSFFSSAWRPLVDACILNFRTFSLLKLKCFSPSLHL